jgi:hypothetical protein
VVGDVAGCVVDAPVAGKDEQADEREEVEVEEEKDENA